jgi:DNA-binding NarL/FixJ family response regulator
MDVLQQLSYGFKRKEIAERLSVSVGTISTHINSIYGKLNVNSNIEAVIFAKSKKLL